MAAEASPVAAVSPSRRYKVSRWCAAAETEVVELLDEDRGVRAWVAPSRGANIVSLARRTDGCWTELLHRGGMLDKPADDAWDGKAPHLFPAVGRHKDGKYGWEGVERPIGLHGFVGEYAFEVESVGAEEDVGAWVDVVLGSERLRDAHRESFPFAFQLRFRVRVTDGSLVLGATVLNAEEARSLPCSIGNHITFRFPFDGAEWRSGTLHRVGAETCARSIEELCLAPGSLLSGAVVARPEFDAPGGFSIETPSACDGVFAGFDGDDAGLRLQVPDGRSVVVRQRVEHLRRRDGSDDAVAALRREQLYVLWGQRPRPGDAADGATGFVCLEPWVGGPDSLNTGVGRAEVPPGGEFAWTMRVEVCG